MCSSVFFNDLFLSIIEMNLFFDEAKFHPPMNLSYNEFNLMSEV